MKTKDISSNDLMDLIEEELKDYSLNQKYHILLGSICLFTLFFGHQEDMIEAVRFFRTDFLKRIREEIESREVE